MIYIPFIKYSLVLCFNKRVLKNTEILFWEWPDSLKPQSTFSVPIGCHTCPFLAAASPLRGFKQNVEGGLLIVLLPV